MKKEMSAIRWWMFWVISVTVMTVYWEVDNRPLVDLGRYYQAIPDWMMFFEAPRWPVFWSLLMQMGGWLNAMLGFWIWCGVSPETAFAVYAILSSGLCWWAIRDVPTLSGLLLLMQPIWQVGWRTQWIHALETSLVLIVWRDWYREQLSLRVGVVGLLAVWLRPSALIWLGLLWMWDVWRYRKMFQIRRSHHHIAWAMGCGILLVFPQLSQYVAGKMAVPRIEWDLMTQIGRHGGLLPTLMMVGCIAAFVRPKGREWMWAIWTMLSLFLSVGFGVGLDNFPLFFMGLALLAGQTKVGFRGQMVVASIAILSLGLPFVPNLPMSLSPWIHANRIQSTPYDFQRPIAKVDNVPDITAMRTILQQLCERHHPHCLVVTSGTLFHPHRESQGRLALLTPALSQIRIEKAELWYRRPQQLAAVQVAIIQNCIKKSDSVWPNHFQHAAQQFESQLHNWTVANTVATTDCQWQFFTPMDSENR